MNKDTQTFLSQFNLNNEEQLQEASKVIYEKMTKENKSLKEILNLSDAFLEDIYSVAFNYYNQGKYKESLSLFYFLISTSPQSYKFIYSYAACLYQIEDYANATLGFFMAHTLDPNDPQSAFLTADCLIKLDRPQEAIYFLDEVISMNDKEAKHSALKERCQLIRSQLQNSLN